MTDCGCGAWSLRIPKNLRNNKIGDVQFVCMIILHAACFSIYVIFFSFSLLSFLTQKALLVSKTWVFLHNRSICSSWSVEWIEIGAKRHSQRNALCLFEIFSLRWDLLSTYILSTPDVDPSLVLDATRLAYTSDVLLLNNNYSAYACIYLKGCYVEKIWLTTGI